MPPSKETAEKQSRAICQSGKGYSAISKGLTAIIPKWRKTCNSAEPSRGRPNQSLGLNLIEMLWHDFILDARKASGVAQLKQYSKEG